MTKLSKADKYASYFYSCLYSAGVRVHVTGAIRRRRPDVKTINVVIDCSIKILKEYIQDFCDRGEMELITRTKNPAKIMNCTIDGIDFVFYKANKEYWGAMVLYTTGSFLFNKVIRAEAKSQGYKLNQYGLWHLTEIVGGRSEGQIFKALGLKLVMAHDREIDNKFKLRKEA